jgi:hypothetical protein
MREHKALPASAKPKVMGARKPSSVICRVASGRSSEVYECESVCGFCAEISRLPCCSLWSVIQPAMLHCASHCANSECCCSSIYSTLAPDRHDMPLHQCHDTSTCKHAAPTQDSRMSTSKAWVSMLRVVFRSLLLSTHRCIQFRTYKSPMHIVSIQLSQGQCCPSYPTTNR